MGAARRQVAVTGRRGPRVYRQVVVLLLRRRRGRTDRRAGIPGVVRLHQHPVLSGDRVIW